MLHYFKKSLPKNAFYSSKGKEIQFPSFGPPRHAIGLLELDSEKQGDILADLQMAVANGNVGGITEIDQTRFEALKKKLTNLPSPAASQPGPFGDSPLQIFKRNHNPFARNDAVPARSETPFQRLVREETGEAPPPIVPTKPARDRRPRTRKVELPPK